MDELDLGSANALRGGSVRPAGRNDRCGGLDARRLHEAISASGAIYYEQPCHHGARIVGAVALAVSGAIENRSVAIAVSTIVAAVVAQVLDVFFASMTVYLA